MNQNINQLCTNLILTYKFKEYSPKRQVKDEMKNFENDPDIDINNIKDEMKNFENDPDIDINNNILMNENINQFCTNLILTYKCKEYSPKRQVTFGNNPDIDINDNILMNQNINQFCTNLILTYKCKEYSRQYSNISP